MVLGMNGKNRKSGSVQVDYLVRIEDIKPWPPSQSLRSLRSVVIQWENGDRKSGSTSTVVPSLGTVVGEGKIEFNESFRLPVTLLREMPVKGKDTDTFQKNCLEFNLYEPRRDNKAQLLATAVIDLADYGVIKETISISAPVNSKRSFRSTPQPILCIKIQPIDKVRTSSSSRDALSKAVSMDKNGGESVSALMNEEYVEEAEVTSFTDDDVSSHSSVANGVLPPQIEENGPNRLSESKSGVNRAPTASKLNIERCSASQEMMKRSSSYSSSIDLSDNGSPANDHASTMNSANSSSLSILKNDIAQSVFSSSSTFTYESKEEEGNTSMRSNGHQDLMHGVHEKLSCSLATIRRGDICQNSKENKSSDIHPELGEKLGSVVSGDFQVNEKYRQDVEEKRHSFEYEPIDNFLHDVSRDEDLLGSDAFSSPGGIEVNGSILKNDRIKHVKSVRSSSDTARNNALVSRNQHNEVGASGDAHYSAGSLRFNERKSAKVYPKDTRTTILDGKVQQLEHKIKMLEGELREAAAIEAALYSVVSEHGSSMSKVHAPARRLSRLYLHACREKSQSRRASAARSAVSGLVLVAKACGNDVPRLTFWLSNSVVLRTIISQAIGDLEKQLSGGPHMQRNGDGKGSTMMSSSLKWKESYPIKKENKNVVHRNFGDWEDPRTFTLALERVEAWIFSRTVESIWWQTLTPHMQSTTTKEFDDSSASKKSLGRTSSLVHEDQVNFSLEHWKKAFKDACERLCPVRAGGHECGCLPILARLIMEQCVARLDVAMFNAILRESADEIPTDPVSDPISDPKVLPIPAGISSFGSGARLKNAIGNWSRWLTDLFGMDDDDFLEDDNENDESEEKEDTSFKSFHLLNALSDLMMLPKDMLLSRSIRKEVCPTFGAPLIKRVLKNFVSDEFCPDPIPDVVFEALDTEDAVEDGEDSVTTIPCIVAAPVYLPPSAASIAGIIGEFGSQPHLRKSGSSILRKSYTSDDELDELNSPLASVFLDGMRSSPTSTKPRWKSKKGIENSIRYELLRDIWMNSE